MMIIMMMMMMQFCAEFGRSLICRVVIICLHTAVEPEKRRWRRGGRSRSRADRGVPGYSSRSLASIASCAKPTWPTSASTRQSAWPPSWSTWRQRLSTSPAQLLVRQWWAPHYLEFRIRVFLRYLLKIERGGQRDAFRILYFNYSSWFTI